MLPGDSKYKRGVILCDGRSTTPQSQAPSHVYWGLSPAIRSRTYRPDAPTAAPAHPSWEVPGVRVAPSLGVTSLGQRGVEVGQRELDSSTWDPSVWSTKGSRTFSFKNGLCHLWSATPLWSLCCPKTRYPAGSAFLPSARPECSPPPGLSGPPLCSESPPGCRSHPWPYS